jgi:hypothetical protein
MQIPLRSICTGYLQRYVFNGIEEYMKKSLLLVVMFSFLALSGCGFTGSCIARFTTDFKVWPSDNRILYENGAEALAKETARHLSQAVTNIEAKQHGTFKDPVKIYAFATTKSFSKFSDVSEVLTGASLKNEVFLSGQLLNKMGKVQGILTHELSHVQLSQKLGTIKFNRTLPRWFREGLAIYVADGGGATNATETETIDKFLEGKHFTPETEGALFNIKLPATGELEPKIFYRQSGMFVQFLAQNHPIQLEKLLRGLQDGYAFETQFSESFRSNVDDVLKNFIVTLQRT